MNSTLKLRRDIFAVVLTLMFVVLALGAISPTNFRAAHLTAHAASATVLSLGEVDTPPVAALNP
ncbi:MAG: hypothetical protein ACHQ1H_02090, partial [Nitrososphaerales archaeon]